MESMIGLLNVAIVKLCLKREAILRLLDWVACVCIYACTFLWILEICVINHLSLSLSRELKRLRCACIDQSSSCMSYPFFLFADVIHTNCLVSHIKSFPPQTASAGYVCPVCSTSVCSTFKKLFNFCCQCLLFSRQTNLSWKCFNLHYQCRWENFSLLLANL